MSDRIHRSIAKRAAGLLLELLLVAVIIGLIAATWLPAMIGANPDADTQQTHHRL